MNIDVKGYGKVSEETIAEALRAKFGRSKKEELYQFKAGDVIRNAGGVRVVVEGTRDKLLVNDIYGHKVALYNQGDFYDWSYRKIGVLSDYIKQMNLNILTVKRGGTEKKNTSSTALATGHIDYGAVRHLTD